MESETVNERVKAVYDGIAFSMVEVDAKEAPWSRGAYRPHWKLRFVYCGKRRSFDFWNNLDNEEISKAEAVHLIVGDALDGYMDLDEFAEELCSGCKVSEALRTWRACKATLRRVRGLLGLGEDDLRDLCNYAINIKNERT